MQLPTRRITSYTFFGLLERTFAIYRENFATVFGIVAIVVVPITIIQYLISPAQATGNVQETIRTGSNGSQILINILSLIQFIFVYGSLSYLTSEALFGRRASMGESFAAVRNRFGSLGCSVILLGIIIALLVVGVVLVFSVIAAPSLALVGLLVFIIVAISTMLVPVLTLENVSAFTGIPRAYGLGKQRFWTVLGLGLVVGLINALAILALTLLGALVLLSRAPIRDLTAASNAQSPVFLILSVVVSIFLLPLTPIAATVLYYDIRVRSEALASQLENSPEGTRPQHLTSPDAPIGFTSNDIRNIIILMVVSLVMGLLLNNAIQLFMKQFNDIMRQRA